MRYFTCILFSITILIQSLAADLWQDPDFVDRFTATYAVRGDLEPTVTRGEQDLLREVATHMPDNPRQAADLLQQSLADDSSAALDFTLGNLRFELDEPAAAEAHFRDAIQKFPDFLRARKNLGLVLVRQGNYAEALEALQRALTLGSVDGDTYGLIGYAHLQHDRWISAESAYRQALLFDPESPNWQIGLARSLQAQERHREANALLSELIGRFPNRSPYWLHQANTYIALDRPLDAAANIELVRRMNDATPESLLLLADIYVNEDLAEQALRTYEEVTRLGAAIPVARAVRAAERLSQQGHSNEAGRLVLLLEVEWPEESAPSDRARFLRLQARLAWDREEDDRAADLLEDALTLVPTDGETLILLARIIAPENLERAEILFERAARLPETEPEALRRHGEILVGAGRPKEALEYLRRAQQLEPRETLRSYIERVEDLVRAREPRR